MEINYIEINKKLWNKKAEIHYDSEFYDNDGFIKGKDSLNNIELELLGNIKGKKVLHLQCHFGQDSISLARHGAIVTAVDFSDVAIKQAKKLNEQIGTNVEFIQSDVYKLSEVLKEKFDIVFTSYGAITWLPDMQKWANIIDHFLKPNGKFVMVEFHPVVWMFSFDFSKIEYQYMNSEPIIEEVEGTYTDRNSAIKETIITWNHGLSTIINSIINTGLKVTDFKEFDYSPYNCFENTIKLDERKYKIKGLEGKIPMLFSIVAEKE